MDRIILKDMAFYGYHGCYEEEVALGQKFIIDLELSVDLRDAGVADDLTQTVNYADVFKLIRSVVEERRFQLIEAVGESVIGLIFKAYESVRAAKILVKKPSVAIGGICDYAAIELVRERADG